VDLTAWTNETNVRIRFILRTDDSVDEDGFYFDDFRIEGQIIATGTPEEAPAVASFAGAWPNPFNPSTTLRFSLAETGPARLAIYDIRGRELAVLHDGTLGAGDHEMLWDGRDGEGRALASGVYLARFEGGGLSIKKKLTLLK